MSYWYSWRSYVPVAVKRKRAEREMAKLRKKGHPVSPVVLTGRTIARTFWGKAWCENLERYSDFANRIPRGRTYVRNGSVVDLQLAPGEAVALVAGSALYTVRVEIAPLEKAAWRAICRDCSGAIDSLVELLQGRLAKGVMERVCLRGKGLFPTPNEISFSCSCPDWAVMCKHVAAVLYGIGARLDEKPELLFRLRDVDEAELITHAAAGAPLVREAPAPGRVLEDDDVAKLFGIEMAAVPEPGPSESSPGASSRRGRGPARARTAKAEPPAARQAAKGRKRKAPRCAVGQKVRYRQGRGTFDAVVVGIDAERGVVLLERTSDGARVTRQREKVLRR